MKVLIADTVSMDRAPYLQYYIDALKKSGVDYRVLVWNRSKDSALNRVGNIYTLNKTCPFGGSKLKKILPMLEYRKVLLNLLDKEQFTHLILINTLASILIAPQVLKSFKLKYVMDIRDYTYERFSAYRFMVNKLVEYSFFTTISSAGFYKFIDKNPKIFINHNISMGYVETDMPTLGKRIPVTIGFVGSVRYKPENMRLINALGDNQKYFLLYAGEYVAGCDLESEITDKNKNNIEFSGAFSQGEKPSIYKKVDLINSLYGNASLEVTTAVPNRFYDALIFKKPILTSKGTYLAHLVTSNQLGISIDVYHDDILQKVEEYTQQFNAEEFCHRCKVLLKKINEEQTVYKMQIKKFLEQ